MSLMPVYVNDIGNHKKKKKTKFKEEHEKWLLKNGCHLSQIRSRKKENTKSTFKLFSETVSKLNSPDMSSVGVTGLKKETAKYTGTEIIGVAVMHKSNLVPIRNKESATDIANMRR